MGFESKNELGTSEARVLLGFEQDPVLRSVSLQSQGDWIQYISQSVKGWPQPLDLLPIGLFAFDAFLQANVTGPPLLWDSAKAVFPLRVLGENEGALEKLRKQLIASLGVDGETVYQLIPGVELFVLAKRILDNQSQAEAPEAVLARMRVNFWHQRMLSDISPTLQEKIYKDLELLEKYVFTGDPEPDGIRPAQFLIERATIHTYHGFDAKARKDLAEAAKARSFGFALTGRLGKRTKFQDKELSQLVVLAKSAESQEASSTAAPNGQSKPEEVSSDSQRLTSSIPQALDLNDDTLLESISFTPDHPSSAPEENHELPPSLQSLDPGNQPLLEPLDAIILLATASSITNTSPADGLTREETLPYAERVISGGSSNWQVYTQALLVRSRIEGYRSRTIERGVLQLQAVVDQVIAETTSPEVTNGELNMDGPVNGASTSFLPQPKRSESAPAAERLKYIHQLASPPRWKLESELADRWVIIGGLRTALEIYQRLQMWAEVALCWAANDREDKARRIIREQLYSPRTAISTKDTLEDDKDHEVNSFGVEKAPLPADAPRLFCILGDIEKSAAAYERAWQVSNHRYARAQRSLGKHYMAAGDLPAADEAYSKSLKVNSQNHPTWFALGCIRLRTEDWAGAVDAFGRAVQVEDTDAESWSNLAVALMNLPPTHSTGSGPERANADSGFDERLDNDRDLVFDSQKHIRESFVALKRAATLKRDSFRIWQNLLSVSVKLFPPPYTDLIIAQSRLIDLLGKLEGEKCLDIEILEALVAHLIAISPSSGKGEDHTESSMEQTKEPSTGRAGLEKMIIDLIQKKVTPLITSSRRLWLLTAKLSLHLNRPSAALASYEKAWRVTLNQPGWDTGGGLANAKNMWREVSQATVDLADAYESLGVREKESGLGAGELVAKDWRFKARSAVRSVLARAKDGWEGDEGYDSMVERLNELKSV